jgi:phage protein D
LVVEPNYSSTPETSAQVTEKHAKADQSKADTSKIQGTIRVLGTPRLRARDMIKLGGIGKYYSGNWRITETKHSFSASGSIYISSAKVCRNAVDQGDKKDKKRGNTKPTGVPESGNDPITVFTDIGGISRY